jgi:hypothetical protein
MAAFAPPPMQEIVDLFNGMILADGGLGVATSLNWDVADPTVRGLFYGLQLYGLPYPLREENSAIIYTHPASFSTYFKTKMIYSKVQLIFFEGG